MKIFFDDNFVGTQYKTEKHYFYENLLTPFKTNVENADIIFSIGGDGTLLKNVHKNFYQNKIYFGLGCGTKNFLLNSNVTEKQIMDIINNDIKIFEIETQTLKITIKNNVYYAVNDIVIGNSIIDFIEFEIIEEEQMFGKVFGSGLVVSTAIGSTAWSKNNGGSILPLNSKDFVINGIGTEKRISEVMENKDILIKTQSRNLVNAYIDGRNIVVEDVNEILIQKGEIIKLGFLDPQEYKIKRRIR